MITKPSFRIFLVEDNQGDARLVKEMLKDFPTFHFSMDTYERLSDLLRSLNTVQPDIILLDLSLPDSHGIGTLLRLRTMVTEPAIIVLTGLDDESVGVNALRNGAQDYLVKDQIDSRILMRTIRYAVERKQMELEKEHLLKELQDLFAQNKKLQGLLPMCSWCKKIRDDEGNWMRLEAYIQENTAAKVSHGICPDCAAKMK